MLHGLTRGLAAISLALGLVATTGDARAAGPIRIGAFLAMTGSSSFLGDPEAKTLRLYVDRINAAGGLNGSNLELVVYDTTGSVDQAIDQALRLIDKDKVELLIGGSTTQETAPVLDLVEARQIPLISLAAGFALMDTVRKWVFAVPHSDRMAVRRVFEDLQRRNLHGIGIIGGYGYYDSACRGSARSLAPEYHVSILADQSFGRFGTPTDTVPYLKAIKATEGVQAILDCGFGESMVAVAHDYRALGMTGLPLYFTQGVASARFIAAAQGAAEGIRLSVSAVLVADQLPADNPQVPVAMAYRAAYSEAYKEPVSAFGGHAYDALMLAADAIKRSPAAPTPAQLRDALEQTKGLVGAGGVFTMSPTDHRGVTKKTLYMAEVRDGKWKLLAEAR